MSKYRIFFGIRNNCYKFDKVYSFFLIPTIHLWIRDAIEWDRMIGLYVYFLSFEIHFGIQYNNKNK